MPLHCQHGLADLSYWEDKRKRAHLLKAGFITAGEALALSPALLAGKARIPLDEADGLLHALAAWRVPRSHTVDSILDESGEERLLKTGVDELDNALNGGLRTGAITELVGEASAGKSHLALQLSLQVQLPEEDGGLNGSVAYLSSEGTFPSNRLLQLIRLQRNEENRSKSSPDRVYLSKASTFEELQHCVRYVVPNLATRLADTKFPLRLVVVDSLAAPVRAEYASGAESLMKRGKDLTLFGQLLKSLVAQHSFVAVVINQVSDVPARPFKEPHVVSREDDAVTCDFQISYDSQITLFAATKQRPSRQAALGLVWANCVDTRVFLSRSNKRNRENGSTTDQPIRILTVLWSAFGPSMTVNYLIGDAGVVGTGEPAVECPRFTTFSEKPQTSDQLCAKFQSTASRSPSPLTFNPTPTALDEDAEFWSQIDEIDLVMLEASHPQLNPLSAV